MSERKVKVLLTTAIEGEDTVTASYDGLLRVLARGVSLTYTENTEGAVTTTRLLIERERMSLLRSGAVSFRTVYEVGKPCRSSYRLGGMAFDAFTETESLTVLSGMALPAVDCVYRLTLGGETRHFSLSLRLSESGVKA